MERKVYLTRLRPEFREKYLEAHHHVPPAVLGRYQELGMTLCSVHVLGDMLVMIVEAEDHARLQEALAADPIDIAWQSQVRPMKADGDWQEMAEVFCKDWE
jgi:L-rhamnose mutarotase